MSRAGAPLGNRNASHRYCRSPRQIDAMVRERQVRRALEADELTCVEIALEMGCEVQCVHRIKRRMQERRP